MGKKRKRIMIWIITNLWALHTLNYNLLFYKSLIQNERLYDICCRSKHIKYPSYEDFNYIIGCQMSDFSSSLRFSGDQNADMRKILVNICPYPRLHFFGWSFTPYSSVESDSKSEVSFLYYSIANQLSICRVCPSRVTNFRASKSNFWR